MPDKGPWSGWSNEHKQDRKILLVILGEEVEAGAGLWDYKGKISWGDEVHERETMAWCSTVGSRSSFVHLIIPSWDSTWFCGSIVLTPGCYHAVWLIYISQLFTLKYLYSFVFQSVYMLPFAMISNPSMSQKMKTKYGYKFGLSYVCAA